MVFPNPAKDRVTFGGIEASEIQLYNLQGQSVKTFNNTNEINVCGLPEGIYLLRITDREGVTRSTRLTVE